MGIDIDIRSVPGFSAYIAIVWIVPLASTLAAAKRLGKFGFRFVYILIPLASYATWSLLFFPGFFSTNPTWNFVIDPLILAIATPVLLLALAKFPTREPALGRFPLGLGIPSGIALGILVWALTPPVQLYMH
jgi:hypothetical protein